MPSVDVVEHVVWQIAHKRKLLLLVPSVMKTRGASKMRVNAAARDSNVRIWFHRYSIASLRPDCVHH